MNVCSDCQVKSNIQTEGNVLIVTKNNTKINESVFIWSRTT